MVKSAIKWNSLAPVKDKVMSSQSFKFVRLRIEDGSWQGFLADWQQQCANYDEDFDLYEREPIDVVRDLAEGVRNENSGVYSVYDGKHHAAMCQVNVAVTPGYTGRVLRVRLIYLSPHLDFGASENEYASVLAYLFGQIIVLSDTQMEAPHVKFHLRSPADRQFFKIVESQLDNAEAFESVQLMGTWLYVSKKLT